MIGIALSGGGSRAIAFHLGCLRALHDLGVLDDASVISTISGGSVIGAYYAYTPEQPFAEFEDTIRAVLRRGFQRALARAVFGPWNLTAGLSNLLASGLHVATGIAGFGSIAAQCRHSRTDLFRAVIAKELFGDLRLTSPRRRNMDVIIGACDLRTGSAFRFSNDSIGGWRHGEAIDGDSQVAFAVAASAAYPLLLPALDRTWSFRKRGIQSSQRVLLTDGGVYDNLGVAVLEPGRSETFNLHYSKCDHLVICSAGHGQELGTALPVRFFSRVSKSFEIVHRRVQDSAMKHLHTLRENHLIKGFALPYLGQQDDALPYKPAGLVTRSEVIGYPTNFAAMSEEWIERLSNRGEQLTRLLVPHYLGEICH
jgi:NTE family protein